MNQVVHIAPAASGLVGEMTLPGDKSICHRAVLFAALARGESCIHNFSGGADNISTVEVLSALGTEIHRTDNTLWVKGRGWKGLTSPSRTIDCGNSGTTMRLFAGVLAGQPFASCLDGDASLRSRPMGRVITPLRQMGAEIVSEKGNGRAPLYIEGRLLHGIMYRGEVASAQVKSALILAGLQATGVTRVWEPVKSRDHTERLLSAFGVQIGVNGQEVEITGGQDLWACEVTIPGDLSSAAFFLAAALLVPGSCLRMRGVGVNPTRTGIIDIFRAMGGEIEIETQTETSGELVGDLVVRSSVLRGTTVAESQVVRMIDEIPILAVVAACARGTTTIRGAQELRVKESDRLHSLAVELGKLGVIVEELPDGLVIEGRTHLRGGRVRSYGDHRIAMALAVAGLVAEDGVMIEGAECADVSFVGFYHCLQGFIRHEEERLGHCG